MLRQVAACQLSVSHASGRRPAAIAARVGPAVAVHHRCNADNGTRRRRDSVKRIIGQMPNNAALRRREMPVRIEYSPGQRSATSRHCRPASTRPGGENIATTNTGRAGYRKCPFTETASANMKPSVASRSGKSVPVIAVAYIERAVRSVQQHGRITSKCRGVPRTSVMRAAGRSPVAVIRETAVSPTSALIEVNKKCRQPRWCRTSWFAVSAASSVVMGALAAGSRQVTPGRNRVCVARPRLGMKTSIDCAGVAIQEHTRAVTQPR